MTRRQYLTHLVQEDDDVSTRGLGPGEHHRDDVGRCQCSERLDKVGDVIGPGDLYVAKDGGRDRAASGRMEPEGHLPAAK